LLCIALLSSSFLTANSKSKANNYTSTIDLSGEWRFQLDSIDIGLKNRWFESMLSDSIKMPNTTDVVGKGHKNGAKLALAGRLTRNTEYTGAAWYQREIIVPKQWTNRAIKLMLERVHWESRLWIDDQEIGMQESLSAPHEFDLTDKLTAGLHRITLRVDNSIKYKVGEWAHSITDETMGNWNGIIGRMELQLTDMISLENIRVGSDMTKKIIWIDGEIFNNEQNKLSGIVSCRILSLNGKSIVLNGVQKFSTLNSKNAFRIELPMNDKLEFWDEFTPKMYLAQVSLNTTRGKKSFKFSTTIPFGIREFSTHNGQFLINGRPTFLRGNLTGGEFPLSGHFPMDVAGWERVIRIMKSYGLNHLRFHSFCPPNAAFEAADRLGFYFCPEAPFWTKLKGNSPEGKYLREEAFRMIKTYGNHPSFVMMGLGNELGGDNPFFSSILCELKQEDSRRLYTCDVNEPTTGKRKSPIDDCDFFVTRHTEKGGLRLGASPRFQQSLVSDGTDCDYVEATSAVNVPLVAHELGQWAVYPSGKEIPKYTGVMKPYNLKYFRNLIEIRGLGTQAEMISKASGRLAWQLYKEDMELCLRTPNFGGFQLLQLQDFPGQGDALVGMLDAFWETKGIVTPEEFRGVCSETVLLARFANFVWTNNQTFVANIEVAHYGRADIKNTQIHWTLVSTDGKYKKVGIIKPIDIKQGAVMRIGKIELPLDDITEAKQLKLIISIEGTAFKNEWPIWVYPQKVSIETPSNILIADSYNAAVKTQLANGGTVLLSIPTNAKTDSLPRILRTRFKTVFWSYPWRNTRHEGTMGLLCDPLHPALKHFPTDYYSNWQWSELINGARAFVLNDTPTNYLPIVQGIDDFHRAWKLGHIIEGRVGNGRIILCGYDLHTDLEHRVVARQLRQSLLKYIVSNEFKPVQFLNLDQLFEPSLAASDKVIFASTSKYVNQNPVKKSDMDIVQGELDQFNKMATSKLSANGAAAAFDLNWESDWVFDGKNLPQEIQVDFYHPTKLRGLLYKPTVNGANRVREFDVYMSKDTLNWGKPVVHFSAISNTKWFSNILFNQAQTGRYLRIVVTAGFGHFSELRIGEFEPLYE
jgi:hypothetical protein